MLVHILTRLKQQQSAQTVTLHMMQPLPILKQFRVRLVALRRQAEQALIHTTLMLLMILPQKATLSAPIIIRVKRLTPAPYSRSARRPALPHHALALSSRKTALFIMLGKRAAISQQLILQISSAARVSQQINGIIQLFRFSPMLILMLFTPMLTVSLSAR